MEGISEQLLQQNPQAQLLLKNALDFRLIPDFWSCSPLSKDLCQHTEQSNVTGMEEQRS